MNIFADIGLHLSGLERLRTMMAEGRLTGIEQTLGLRIAEVEEGRVVVEGTPGPHVYNPFAVVHGGFAAAILDNACGYAAQSKLHTRNFVGPSGKIYVGSKQGYPTAKEHEALKRGEKIPTYRGGYVMVYDPATDKAENLGMPMPLTDQQIAAGKKEGQGVIDVTADEERGLIYVIDRGRGLHILERV